MKAVQRRPAKRANNVPSAYRAIVEALALDQKKAERLVEDFNAAHLAYRVAVGVDEVSPSGKAAAAALADIKQSIARIARATAAARSTGLAKKFQPMRRGISRMQKLAENWATMVARHEVDAAKNDDAVQDDQEVRRVKSKCDKLLAIGVDPGMGKGAAADAVCQWFNSAVVIGDLLKDAIRSLEAEERARAKEELCGRVLPELYARYSGKPFKIDGRARDIAALPGVAFVIAAHQAFGLGDIAPGTILTHWKKSQKRTT